MSNYYTTIQPILRIFQFFGFAPYRIALNTSSNRTLTIHRSSILTVQTVLMLCIICAHFIYMLYVLIFLVTIETASAVVISAWMLGLLIINILIFLQAWLVSANQMTLLAELAKIDTFIRRHLRPEPNHQPTGRQRMQNVCLTLAIVMLGKI